MSGAAAESLPPERGVARAILRVLAARGLVLSVRERQRVLACEDLPTLERWLLGAATAAEVAEVLT